MFIKPDIDIKNIYDIDLEKLKAEGIKGMLFDLDSTLMASKSGTYSDKMLDWLKKVKEDFFVAVVSNNKNPEYAAKVEKVSDFPLLFDAKKPKIDATLKFLKEHNINPKECAFVGDRPLTDVLCGQRLGCKTIMVDSITADTEAKIVRFVRTLEKLTLRR